MFKGRVWKFRDNVNTDEIIPARYLNTSNPTELAEHCMEDIDPQFSKKAKKGDIIVGGYNFGCGSSREHAPLAIKTFGISCVIAKSFARIFYRNAINIGLPIMESEELFERVKDGDLIEVYPEKGEIILSDSSVIKVQPFSKDLLKIINANGLVNYAKELLKNK